MVKLDSSFAQNNFNSLFNNFGVEHSYQCLQNSLKSFSDEICKQAEVKLPNAILIKIQLDATVSRLIYFTAKTLYIFRVFTAPITRSTKNCNRSLRYRS